MDDLASRAARAELAAWFGGQAVALPVPVADLAVAAGLEVAHFAPEDHPGTQGFLDPEEPLVWLAAGLTPEVERFTLAHELGHWRLHRREQDQCADLDFAPEAALAPEEAYSPRSRREQQANAFAAALLAPLQSVAALFLGADGAPPLTPEAIARRAGVSLAVVRGQIVAVLVRGQPPAATEPESSPVPAAPPALDASQRAAAAVAAPALVVAGPGTGKTSTLVARVRHLVAQGTAPASILALTFSRKAAGEMRDRLAALMEASDAPPTVTTFHSFGGDLLRSYGHLIGLRPDFRLIDEIGAYFLLRDLGPRLPLDYYAGRGNPAQHFGTLLSAISKAKDELAGPEHYAALAATMAAAAPPEDAEAAARAAEVAAVYAVYQDALAQRGDADYGDLIMQAVRLLRECPDVLAALRDQYRHVLVDEFQDINRANGVLLRLLAGDERRIWAVGDANQAIYRFRGASPANIADFATDYPGAQIVALTHNYRSRPAIVAAANRFAAAELTRPDASPVALIPTRPPAPESARLRVAPDGPSEIADLVAAVVSRRAAGTPPGDLAVLCRTNGLARRIAAQLIRAGIPAEARTDAFDDPALKLALGVAHLAAGEDVGLLAAARVPDHALAPATLRRLLDEMRARHASADAALFALLDAPDLPPDDRAALRRIRDGVQALRAQPNVATGLAQYLLAQTETGRRALQAGGETAAHLGELLRLAQRFDQERPPGGAAATEMGAIRRWRALLAFLRGARTLARGLAGDNDGPERAVVRVLTIHGAKGLEWPVVFVPDLAAGKFPIRARGDQAPLPPGLADDAGADPKAAHRLEEACLFYVAITRARDELILSRAARARRTASNPSPFLAPLLAADVAAAPAPAYPDAAPDDDDDAPDDELPPDVATIAEFSVGAITTYDSCPRQYAYRYGHQLGSGPGSFGRMTRAVGAALREAAAEHADVQRALGIYDAQWQADVAPDDEDDPFADLYRRQGREAVHQGFGRLQASAAPDADFARQFAVQVDDASIHVALDRLERTAQPVGIRHAVGRRRGVPEPDLRYFLATLAVRQWAGDETASVLEHRLTTDELVPVPLTAAAEARLWQRVRAAVAGIRRGDFPARPDPRQCAGCAFALICPR